jgi:hypothetical protein
MPLTLEIFRQNETRFGIHIAAISGKVQDILRGQVEKVNPNAPPGAWKTRSERLKSCKADLVVRTGLNVLSYYPRNSRQNGLSQSGLKCCQRTTTWLSLKC